MQETKQHEELQMQLKSSQKVSNELMNVKEQLQHNMQTIAEQNQEIVTDKQLIEKADKENKKLLAEANESKKLTKEKISLVVARDREIGLINAQVKVINDQKNKVQGQSKHLESLN